MTVYSLKKLREAASTEPVDWLTINGERITLETMADTRAKRDAVALLRYATVQNIHRAITALEVAFAPALIYDEQGFPKLNPNYQARKPKR